jgi:hypothetical protein
LVKFREENQIRAIQLQITKGEEIMYNINLGEKNDKN